MHKLVKISGIVIRHPVDLDAGAVIDMSPTPFGGKKVDWQTFPRGKKCFKCVFVHDITPYTVHCFQKNPS